MTQWGLSKSSMKVTVSTYLTLMKYRLVLSDRRRVSLQAFTMRNIIIFMGYFFTLAESRTERIFKSGKGCGTTKPIKSTNDPHMEEDCTMITVHSQDLGKPSNHTS